MPLTIQTPSQITSGPPDHSQVTVSFDGFSRIIGIVWLSWQWPSQTREVRSGPPCGECALRTSRLRVRSNARICRVGASGTKLARINTGAPPAPSPLP
jgi:hypothetical protein